MIAVVIITLTYITILFCDKKTITISMYSSIIFISLLLISRRITLSPILVSFILAHIIISILIYILGRDKNIKDVDTILILGNSLKNDQITSLLQYRLDLAILLTKQYSQAKIIVSGGKTHESTITEASAMKAYLTNHGVINTIIEEDLSRDTYENMVNSKGLVDISQTVLIITNRFHMYRSILLAKKAGYQIVGSKAAKTGVKALYYYLYEIYAFYIFKRDGKL